MGEWDLVLSVGDGRLARDESQARNVPADLSFSTTWQGGFKALDCSLLRSLDDTSTERPFDAVKVTAQGGSYTVWEGRLQRMPRTVRRYAQMAPSALGWATVLEDRQDARALFVNRDLAQLQPASAERKSEIIASTYAPQDWSAQSATLRAESSAGWSSTAGRHLFAAQYIPAPLRVAKVGWIADNLGRGVDWVGYVGEVNSDGTWVATMASDWFDSGIFDPRLYDVGSLAGVEIGLYLADTSLAEGARYTTLTNLFFVGDHDIPLTGTGPADYGVKASDAVQWLVSEYGGVLRVGEIVDSQIGIPHLAFTDPQSPGSILNAINAYHAWPWGVWEDREFHYHPYGGGRSRTWYVRAGDAGVELTQDGDDAAQLWSDMVVQYTTATGETRTVGAPGTVADEFDSLLQITDTSHPAVAAGNRRVYLFNMGAPCIKETAVAVGALMLEQLNNARRAGTAQVQGYVMDESGREFPCYMVRGGDQLVVVDGGDTVPRRIVETTYQHSARAVSLVLDNTLQTVEAIISHLGARATGRL